MLLRGAWAPVHVRLDPVSRRLSVSHDGVVRVATTLPTTFAPQPTWQFALSGCVRPPMNATVAASVDDLEAGSRAAVLIDHFSLSSPTFYDEREVPLRISRNADALSLSSTPFAYYAPPRLFSISPSSGPAAGLSLVTVTGLHVHGGSDYRCRFGTDVIVYATMVLPMGHVERVGEVNALRCRTPALLAGTAYALELSLNGQQFTTSTHAAAISQFRQRGKSEAE